MNTFPANTTNLSHQVLHFLIKSVCVCIELPYVIKTLPLPYLETVPNSPFYFVGLMNLSGTSIPVIDLALRVGLHRTENYSLDVPILLCECNGNHIGLIVDKILGLATINLDELQMREEFKAPNSLFSGTITFNNALSLLLNIKFILSSSFTTSSEQFMLNYDLMKMVSHE